MKEKMEEEKKVNNVGETDSSSLNEKITFKEVFKKIYTYVVDLVKLNEDTDVDSTIMSIKTAVEFRGVNTWILAFAIIVASVGLNVNSTAVIIGAMLISPLMGPINGIGLAIGISDSELLRKSLKNLLVMVVISLLASSSYFLLTPLSDAQSELLARTTPTIFDVFIAFFGGFAGIVAISRKDQPFTVISGVAIATALMPPLCTAGYGIGTGQMQFFIGAFYLFFINSFFIALATFIMVRYLKFPQKKYVDEKRHKFVKRSIYIFSIIVLIPSIFIAYNVVNKASFETQTIKYINAIQTNELFNDIQLVNYTKDFDKKTPTISLSLIGRELTEKEQLFLKKELNEFGLKNTNLVIKQTGAFSSTGIESELLENVLAMNERQIAKKDSTIFVLQEQNKVLRNNLDIYDRISLEMAVQYPEIKSFSIANTFYYDIGDSVTKKELPTIYLVWQQEAIAPVKEKLNKWLQVRLNVNEIQLVDVKDN